MWSERFLKVIPAVVFFFCVLEIFEMALVINNMNKTEEIESQLSKNLETLKTDINLLRKYSEGLQQEKLQSNKNRCIKTF